MKNPTKEFLVTNKPVKPPQDEFGGIDKEIYKEEVKQLVQRKMNLRRNIEKSYGLIWGQCSSGLKQYMKGLQSYTTNAKICDTTWLLKELKKATSGIYDQANAHVNMHRTVSNLYKMKQCVNEANDHFLDRFKSNLAALDLAGGGHLFVLPVITGEKIENMTEAEITEETEKSHATLLLLCSDDTRYGDLVASLNSGTLRGRDEYPETLASIYQLMIKHSSALQNLHGQASSRRRQAVSLVQTNIEESQQELVPGTDGRTHEVTCFNCNRRGHYTVNYNEPDSRIGLSNLQFGNVLVHVPASTGIIPPDWVLLDTCSTDNVIMNINLFNSVTHILKSL